MRHVNSLHLVHTIFRRAAFAHAGNHVAAISSDDSGHERLAIAQVESPAAIVDERRAFGLCGRVDAGCFLDGSRSAIIGNAKNANGLLAAFGDEAIHGFFGDFGL